VRNEYEQAVSWFTKGAKAGLPDAMHNIAVCLDKGLGVAAPDYPAAAGWYRRAADAGNGAAANNLATTSAALGSGTKYLRSQPPSHFRPSFLELNSFL